MLDPDHIAVVQGFASIAVLAHERVLGQQLAVLGQAVTMIRGRTAVAAQQLAA